MDNKFENRIINGCSKKECSFWIDVGCKYPREEKRVCLRPLYEKEVIVHYPWFANTYLLPYFYSKCLKKEDISVFLKELEWGNTTYNEIIERVKKEATKIHLFYSRDITNDDIQTKINNKNSFELKATNRTAKFETPEEKAKVKELTLVHNRNNYYIKRINFCEYFPRFIFFDFSVDTFLTLYGKEKVSEYNSIANFLTEHFLNIIENFDETKLKNLFSNKSIEKIHIFSDIPKEAEKLKEILCDKLKTDESFISVVTSNKSLSELEKGVLNIYFYSAPYNILFLKNKYQYLPVKFQSKLYKKFEGLNTFCYLISKNKNFDTDDKLRDRLEKFFQYVFWKTKETPEHFYDITQSFNFISAVRHPAVTFENEYCFAKCLSLFINPEKIKNDPRKEKEESISKRLIFEALFNNSHSKKYEDAKKELLHNVKQVYALIALNYLTNNIEKFHLHKSKSFSSICEALQNTIFNFGFYNKVLEQFIKYEIAQFIKEFCLEEKQENEENNQHISSNPINEAHKKYEIKKEKICQRLLYEVKYHLNQVLIKECQAEDVFLATYKHIFDIEHLLNEKSSGFTDNEQNATFEHLKGILDNTLKKCAIHYDDIVELDHLGLASIFRNSRVKNLLLKKTTMSPSIYIEVTQKTFSNG
jgi:hypothetical protein